MAQHDVTQFITAYSTHFFPPDAGVPVFVTVYKSGSATLEDVAGHLIFTNHNLTGEYRDRLSGEGMSIIKHFRLSQFEPVCHLLRHRLDYLKQGMSLHYVGDDLVGGFTTLDAGASPGLDPALLPLVTPTMANVPAPKAIEKKSAAPKKAMKKK